MVKKRLHIGGKMNFKKSDRKALGLKIGDVVVFTPTEVECEGTYKIFRKELKTTGHVNDTVEAEVMNASEPAASQPIQDSVGVKTE